MRAEDVPMTLRPLRLPLVAVALLALAVPAASMAGRDRPQLDRGVVQSATADQIVLAELDGSQQTFTVTPATRVTLNGRRADLSEILPGFVAAVAHRGDLAQSVRAFGAVALVIDRGVVTAVSPAAITLREPGDTSVTIALDANTRFRFQGAPTRGLLARPGAIVAVQHPSDGPARVVNVLKRAGA
jgi:hypothetical protein